MIQKVLKKRRLKEQDSVREELAHRVGQETRRTHRAVEYLRRQYYGDSAGLQRIARIIQRPKS